MSRIARGGCGPFRQRAHRAERCARWSGGVLSGSRSAAVPLLAGGGLQAVDGFHLVGDEQIDGGGAGGDLREVAAVGFLINSRICRRAKRKRNSTV